MTNIALEVVNLHYAYSQHISVSNQKHDHLTAVETIHACCLKVLKGQSLGIVGPNGAGKTTLLNILAGFLKPKSGQIKLFGEVVTFKDQALLRQNIGFVFHNPDDQLFMPTIFEDICFGLLCRGEDRRTAEQEAEMIMEQLGLTALKHRFPGHLSAGEKRLAALASVLVMKPSILALDEPTANLDPWARRQLLNVLSSINITKLFISHDLSAVAEVCEQTAILSKGQFVAEGPTMDILSNISLLTKHRLEPPLCIKCNQSIPAFSLKTE